MTNLIRLAEAALRLYIIERGREHDYDESMITARALKALKDAGFTKEEIKELFDTD